MKLNSPKFSKLKKEWYKKLRDSGWVDAEDDKERLIEWHNFKYALKDPLAFKSQERYYSLAGQLLHTHPFPSIRNKTIWRYHCSGIDTKMISSKMGLSIPTVDKVIKELAELIKV